MKKSEKKEKIATKTVKPKKTEKDSPVRVAFEKFISKDEYKVAVHAIGKKKLFEIFVASSKCKALR